MATSSTDRHRATSQGTSRRRTHAIAALALFAALSVMVPASQASAASRQTVHTTIGAGGGGGCVVLATGSVRCWGLWLYGGAHLDDVHLTGTTDVAVGLRHACALSSAGTVRCWGENEYYQLGNLDQGGSATPVLVSGLTGVATITAGSYHTCALLRVGTVRCWGSNAQGQFGKGGAAGGMSPTPATVAGLSGVTGIDAGNNHTCAVRGDGTVRCWGEGRGGELGNGAYLTSTTPVAVSGVTDAVSVSAGYESCAVLSNATVRCWGLPPLGNGSSASSPKPVALSGLSGVRSLSIGMEHSCATLANGTARCWGQNNWGQLGDGTWTTSLVPVTVKGLSGISAVAASHTDRTNLGYPYTCALLVDSRVTCWGSNSGGQLGGGVGEYSPTPVRPLADPAATAIAAGLGHTCAIVAGGAVQCWGSDWSGQLGDGPQSSSLSSVTVVGLTGVTAISASAVTTCALLADTTVRCWGYDYGGTLGDGLQQSSPSPVVVKDLSTVTSLSVGAGWVCALLADHTVSCWGSGTLVPTQVAGLADVVAIDVGVDHACALLGDATVSCWDRGGTPAAMAGLSQVARVAEGYGRSCAVLADQTVRCWQHAAPGTLTTVAGLSGVVAITLTLTSDCALLADGTVTCWSPNGGTPTALAGLSSVTAIATSHATAAGETHTCALLADQTVRCWGANTDGQLGAGPIYRVPSLTVMSAAGVRQPTAAVTVPWAPTALSMVPSNRSVRVGWVAPANGGSPITDYIVQYSSNNGATWIGVNDGVRATTGATVGGLLNGTTYRFRVCAKTAVGIGAWSPASAGATPRTLPSAPAAPTAYAGTGRATLYWKAPYNGGSAITDYVVQFSKDGGITWTTFADGTRTTTSAVVTGLTTGKVYWFRVAARNVAGLGAFSPKSFGVRIR